MVINEKIKEKKIDIKFSIENSKLLERNKLLIPNILTAASVGIERRNEIFAESNLL